jgi:hypothetical protein
MLCSTGVGFRFTPLKYLIGQEKKKRKTFKGQTLAHFVPPSITMKTV